MDTEYESITQAVWDSSTLNGRRDWLDTLSPNTPLTNRLNIPKTWSELSFDVKLDLVDGYTEEFSQKHREG